MAWAPSPGVVLGGLRFHPFQGRGNIDDEARMLPPIGSPSSFAA
ncbi:MAG TPA: hypothetical protein VF014_03425 [Casimicrobiaceae bacterium]|nr:hypothetical protein [Casimicrobiaceae bacterium]